METIFKIGDVVYDSVNYPNQKGEITRIQKDLDFQIRVKFENKVEHYKLDGKIYEHSLQCLSFTPYELKGFSQVRPWTPKEGEYVALKNKKYLVWFIGRFSRINEENLYEIYEASSSFEEIKPLTDFINER